jgi:hypothetical protein
VPAAAYRLLAYLGAIALLVGVGYGLGVKHTRNAVASEVAASLEQARRVETKWQSTFDANARHLTNEINTIAASRDAAVAELRKRPARPAGVSESPRVGCEGANGPELAGVNAEFLERYSALAAQQDAALMSCYALLDGLK